MEVLINPAPADGTFLKDVVPLIAAGLAFLGVLLTIMASSTLQTRSLRKSAEQQADTDQRRSEETERARKRELEEEIQTARGLIFAQISRVYRSIQGEYGYLAESQLRYIWVPLYLTLLPSDESLKRVGVLEAQEVLDVTAFYYSYHEQMGYIASASGGVGRSALSLDVNLLGVDVSAADLQLKWVMDAFAVMERKAWRALKSIEDAAGAKTFSSASFKKRLIDENLYGAGKAQGARPHIAKVKGMIERAEALRNQDP